MADDKLAELLMTQKSLTEWLEDIRHKDAAIIRKEDNDKRERLKVLNKIVGLPYDAPTQFEATDIADKTPAFTTFLKERGKELCALRLMPKADGLPKLRMRGKSIADAYEWFLGLEIDPSQYRADFVPHAPDNAWATIFVVNKHGIQGEIIYGGHHQLTQGFHDAAAPHVFRYDFSSWSISPANDEAVEYLKGLVAYIHVPDSAKQQELAEKLDATFSHNYLEGYFETTHSSMGTWYIDYSRTLGAMYADLDINPTNSKGSGVTGLAGSPGTATGPVKIVPRDQLDVDFPAGSILVCTVTSPDYVPLMQKAAAIVTDQGGILSHAAIVARELHKPCIVGTGNATKQLIDGAIVTVDADAGTVTVQE